MDLQEYIDMWTDWWTEFVRKKKAHKKKGKREAGETKRKAKGIDSLWQKRQDSPFLPEPRERA